MKIAFYAPMKPIDHPVPSGDQRMAKLIIQALEMAGHEEDIASDLRSYDGVGDAAFQARIQKNGLAKAENYVKNHSPNLWFTYHLYHKAPDWIGPAVAQSLKIPYVVAEASIAPKQVGGKWDLNHKSVGYEPTVLPLHHATRPQLVSRFIFFARPEEGVAEFFGPTFCGRRSPRNVLRMFRTSRR